MRITLCVVRWERDQSYADRDAELIYRGFRSRRYGGRENVIERKVLAIDQAHEVSDLGNAPGNHLEKLKRDREGQYSIRINAQFRICFEWRESHAYNVEIVDYH